MATPKSKKFNGKWYKYAGFTYSEKSNKRRKLFWEKLGYSVRFIPSHGYGVRPLPKSKFLVYVRKKSKTFRVKVKFKTNKDGTVDIISSKNVLKKKRKLRRKK